MRLRLLAKQIAGLREQGWFKERVRFAILAEEIASADAGLAPVAEHAEAATVFVDIADNTGAQSATATSPALASPAAQPPEVGGVGALGFAFRGFRCTASS